MSELRCADASAAAGERLAGTAVTVENWLLLERRGTWPRDVTEALAPGERGSDALRDWLERTPSSRFMFVRRPRASAGERVGFVVRSSDTAATVRRLAFDELDDLADVDLAREGEPIDLPLVLVCGHGTRDACCALRGNVVHAELARHVPPEALWLSSHQGGHRFAANVLVLPSGIQLGRVDPEDAASVVRDACSGRISLAHYRGRTTYAPHVQAAEVAAREAAGLNGVDELVLEADDGARVSFRSATGRMFRVEVEEVPGPAVPASCGVAPEPQRAFGTRLL